MSVKQLPDGSWYYRFQVGKHPRRKQGFRTRTEAEKAQTIAQAEAIRRAACGEESRNDLRLCEAADMFFEEYAKPYKRSWQADRAYLKAIKEFFREKRLRDIKPRDVESYRAWVYRTVEGVTQKQVSWHTVNHYHAGLMRNPAIPNVVPF